MQKVEVLFLVFLIFFVATLCSSASVSSDETKEKDLMTSITGLNPSNLHEELKSGKLFVKFYAPWCGFCQKLAPTWEKLATELEGQIKVVKVDCSNVTTESICAYFDVTSFPTLKLINNGKVTTYDGERDLEKMKKWALQTEPDGNLPDLSSVGKKVKKNKWSKDSRIIDLYDFNMHEIKSGTWFIEFYADWCSVCNAFIPKIEKLAADEQLKHIKIAKANIELLPSPFLRAFSISRVPTLRYVVDGQLYNMSYHDQPLQIIVNYLLNDYKEEESSPLPAFLASLTPESPKIDSNSIPHQPTETTFVKLLTSNETSAIMGICAGLCLFVFGFIFGRFTAPQPTQTRPAKLKKK
jgi:protein disulfide-isomerase-like protein